MAFTASSFSSWFYKNTGGMEFFIKKKSKEEICFAWILDFGTGKRNSFRGIMEISEHTLTCVWFDHWIILSSECAQTWRRRSVQVWRVLECLLMGRGDNRRQRSPVSRYSISDQSFIPCPSTPTPQHNIAARASNAGSRIFNYHGEGLVEST